MKTYLNVPKFSSEAEEVAWLEANRDLIEAAVVKAAEEGNLRQRGLENKSSKTGRGLELTDEQLLQAHEAAQRHGMTFQQYLNKLVLEGLERDKAA
jgi:hypothetical protein